MTGWNRVNLRTVVAVTVLHLSVTLANAQNAAIEQFEKKVRPLLLEKCVSCHGPDKDKSGLRVDSRAALLLGGDRGTAVVPGKPAESLLLRTLAHDGELKMPPKNKLSVAEITAVTEWVKAGAPWPNSGGEGNTTPTPKGAAREFTAEERNFWAFRPIAQVQAPVIKPGNSLIQNEIDRFLLAKLNEQGLGFAAPADKRTLLRRLTFDLTGLPPTPEETASFLKDSSPDAYAKLVERLLASREYGEKWGRRWLDVARYADSNGMDENLAYVNAWRYRDWVIKSFNSDKPYDQFVREQIAGDLMPGGTVQEQADRITATGFLVIGPKMLAEDDPMKMRMDIIDEQLDTVGQAFLGLTFGCARCHDHKFDPITAADYYSLAGIFYSTKTMQNYNVVATWNERPVGSPELQAALTAHQKKRDESKKLLTAAERKLKSKLGEFLSRERPRVVEYVSAAAEAYRRRGPDGLIVPDPTKNAPKGTMVREAEHYTKGNLLKLTDGYGEGIGVVINRGELPNFVEYTFNVQQAGLYQLAVRYAAAGSRPVRLLQDGKLLTSEACGKETGSWNPDTQTWHAEAMLSLPAGKTVLRFERDGPFPHLDKFAIIPVSKSSSTESPITPAELAKARQLSPTLLQQWLELLIKKSGQLPTEQDRSRIVNDRNGPFRSSTALEKEVNQQDFERVQSLRVQLAELEKSKPAGELVMAVEEGRVENLKIHLRGNHLTLGDETPRQFPKILRSNSSQPVGSDRSGRLELAEWLTRPDHPLTSRVMVNRIWAGHFGTGLVRSPDNFGKLGERPTHPELLDWLAREFVQANWSIKHLHRLIVHSAAYQMSSAPDPAVLERDPENQLYSHFNRRRLEAEEIRDGMLAIAGLLDRTPGGSILKSTPRAYVNSTGSKKYDAYDTPRRSVYLPIIRSGVYEVLQTLDFPDPSVPSGKRTASTIPTQALLLLNSSLADKTSAALATTVLKANNDVQAQISDAYRRTLGRDPSQVEMAKVQDYLKKSEDAADPKLIQADRRLRAFQGLCRVLFASNEYIFVE